MLNSYGWLVTLRLSKLCSDVPRRQTLERAMSRVVVSARSASVLAVWVQPRRICSLYRQTNIKESEENHAVNGFNGGQWKAA